MILGCADGDEKVVAAIPSSYVITSTDPSFSFRMHFKVLESILLVVTFCFLRPHCHFFVYSDYLLCVSPRRIRWLLFSHFTDICLLINLAFRLPPFNAADDCNKQLFPARIPCSATSSLRSVANYSCCSSVPASQYVIGQKFTSIQCLPNSFVPRHVYRFSSRYLVYLYNTWWS